MPCFWVHTRTVYCTETRHIPFHPLLLVFMWRLFFFGTVYRYNVKGPGPKFANNQLAGCVDRIEYETRSMCEGWCCCFSISISDIDIYSRFHKSWFITNLTITSTLDIQNISLSREFLIISLKEQCNNRFPMFVSLKKLYLGTYEELKGFCKVWV